MTVKELTNLIFKNLMEVSDPSMSVLAEGHPKNPKSGPKFFILRKIEYSKYLPLLNIGQINNIVFNTNTKNYNHYRTFHTRVKAASRIGPHNQDVISVVVGSLLGDCYANKRSVEGTRLCYRQSIIHKDYLY